MKRAEAFAASYLHQDDLPQPRQVVIEAVGKEMMTSDDNGQREKPVAYFVGEKKGMVLNVVNWTTLEDAFGEDSDGWTNKPVELYVDRNVMYQGRKVGGIRVRVPNSQPLTLEQALKAIGDAQISREQLKAEIKRRHNADGYNPARDTALVMELVSAKPRAAIPLDDIPF